MRKLWISDPGAGCAVDRMPCDQYFRRTASVPVSR
jgi:hypothetical protein